MKTRWRRAAARAHRTTQQQAASASPSPQTPLLVVVVVVISAAVAGRVCLFRLTTQSQGHHLVPACLWSRAVCSAAKGLLSKTALAEVCVREQVVGVSVCVCVFVCVSKRWV